MSADHSDDESSPITWPSDVGSARYAWGDQFVRFSDLQLLWDRIATACADPDERPAMVNYLRNQHLAAPMRDHWLFNWANVEPDRLLYHYTPATRLSDILKSGSLRMGPLIEMRDPREFCEWELHRFVRLDTAVDHRKLDRAAAALRNNTKVVCFGQDQPSEEPPEALARLMAPYKGRGFLRPRMWEQYGDAHRGVCLILDREAIDRTFRRHLAEAIEDEASLLPKALPFHGKVHYDDSFDRRLRAGQLGLIDDENCPLSDWLTSPSWIREAFLTKDIDWFTEHEYRWGLMTSRPGPLFVDLEPGCLVGVVVGLRWDESKQLILESFAQQFKITANVAQVTWEGQQLGGRLVDLAVTS